MPIISDSWEEPTNRDGTWSHVFQGGNSVWLFDQTQRMGNFFVGLQGQTQNAWNTQIPPKSEILAATMEYLPFNNNLNPSFDITMNSPDRVLNLQNQDPLQSPFQIHRDYRRDFWSNAQVGALSTTFTAVFGTSVTTNANWIMRQLTQPGGTIPIRDHMAQKITTRTGNMTIDFLFWDLSRTGNPAGDLTVRIQGVAFDRGVAVPDGIDIGVSDPVSCASIPLAQTTTPFRFTINGNPTLVALTDYFILIEGTYASNNVDYIHVWHQNTFLTNGQLFHFGDGLGMDWQNHPGIVDLNQAHQANLLAGQDVIWPIDTQALGVPEVSPDISALVQAQVDASNYTADSGIIISLSRAVPTSQGRIMSSNVHATNAGPILRITYGDPPPVDDFHEVRYRQQLDKRILRDDDEIVFATIVAFMEIRDRWH